jgi:hypothetical protein
MCQTKCDHMPLIRIDRSVAICEECGKHICDECGHCFDCDFEFDIVPDKEEIFVAVKK